MAYGENIGQPWVHKGVKCAKCEMTPISGYRYKCKKRPDYDLCQACFRREIPDPKIKYLRIERSKTTGPYQVHFVECVECGVAPIKGKRYRHKTQQECDLCEACFLRVTNPSNRRAEPESDYELFEELVINSVCMKYEQVFHFDKRCDECLVSPICGPTFTSLKNPDYDLCAFCHDEKLQNDSIRAGDFVSREKPDVSAVYHLNIICCVHCGMTPIKGPAFKHRRDPNKTLCLVCYYHVQEEKQRYFTRIDPPRQAEKGGPAFTLKPKASAQVPASATKTPASKMPSEAAITDSASSTAETNSKSDSVPIQAVGLSAASDTNEGGVASRGYGGRSNLKFLGTNSTATPDSSEEGGVAPRGYAGRSSVKSNGTKSATSPDSNEDGVAARGYGARSTISSNATSPLLTPSPKITARTAVEIKTSSPPLYTAGLRTSRTPSPAPKLPSPPSPQPVQSALKSSSSSPAAPKPNLKVTFAEPEQQPPPPVKFSPSLQPPQSQQPELTKSSPPQSQLRVYPPPTAQNSIPQYQQRGFSQPAAVQQPTAPSSTSVYPPSSQSQSSTAVPRPQVPNYAPGASPNYPTSAADYLAAMSAAQNNSAQQTIAMLNAIRMEKERSNMALLQQILQRTQVQQGVDYSALLGNTGGGNDYSALFGNTGGANDYSALLNGGGGIDFSGLLSGAAGGGGMDFSTLIGSAGANTDLAALLGGQNNLGGLAGVINSLGALGLGG